MFTLNWQDENDWIATFAVGSASLGAAGDRVITRRRRHPAIESSNQEGRLSVRRNSDIDVHQLLGNDHNLEEHGRYGQHVDDPLLALWLLSFLIKSDVLISLSNSFSLSVDVIVTGSFQLKATKHGRSKKIDFV